MTRLNVYNSRRYYKNWDKDFASLLDKEDQSRKESYISLKDGPESWILGV